MFREMRYVMEVYREGSFSRAAQKLYISQPSLSQMIKKVEEKVGSPLFDRSASPVRLTETGRAYLRAAEQIQEAKDGFCHYLSDAEACLTGSLSLGGTTLLTSYVLAPLISAFSARFPRVDVRIHETHTAQLERDLQAGELDFVMENRDFNTIIYQSIPYLRERLLLGVPRHLEVNAQAAPYRMDRQRLMHGGDGLCAPLSLFQNEAFLLLKEGNDTRSRADRLCAQAGFRPRIKLLLDQQLTAYHLACYGLGVCFLSDTLARSVPPNDRLCLYALEGDLARRSICLVYKRNRFLTRPMREFLRLLSEPAHGGAHHSDPSKASGT